MWPIAEWATAERATDLMGSHTLGHGTPSLRQSLAHDQGIMGRALGGPVGPSRRAVPAPALPRGNLGSYHQKEGLRP